MRTCTHFIAILLGIIHRSNLQYQHETCEETGANRITSATHNTGSTLGAAALIAGTTIGAGVLALPAATAPTGFIPSSGALFLAWMYMGASALLIAELSMNRIADTGRPGVGLLDMQRTFLGENQAKLGAGAYFFLHYVVMVAYVAQGGANLGMALDSFSGIELPGGANQLLFTGAIGSAIYFTRPSFMEKLNNALVLSVLASFVGLVSQGLPSVDFAALIAPEHQDPTTVINTFPIIFLSLVYHNVVPTIVTQLEGDKNKIRTAIIGGSFVPLLMFLTWNAVILGNVYGMPGVNAEMIASGSFDPIALLQQSSAGDGALLSVSNLVGTFSELAVITSMIGFVYGVLDALTDLFNLPSEGPEYEKWKPALFGATLLPPLALSAANPDIFLSALDYGGAFGVSTLFLVLPPLMVWKLRYEDEERKLATLPLLPGGKVSLGGLWKIAGTLILEQGADKLGLLDWVHNRWMEVSGLLA